MALTGLKSLDSTVKAFVLFENKTDRIVCVFWVNHRGRLVPYKSLSPNMTCAVNTYISHPWVFKDTDTGELMQVGHNEVFWPPEHAAGQQERCKAEIKFPVRSLKHNAMWALANGTADPEVVKRMPLPMTLQDELADVYKLKYENA
jgi:von Hippel-Lindau disease tumor supressor